MSYYSQWRMFGNSVPFHLTDYLIQKLLPGPTTCRSYSSLAQSIIFSFENSYCFLRSSTLLWLFTWVVLIMRLQPRLKFGPGGDVGDLLVADGSCAPGSKAGGFLNEFGSAEVIAAGKAVPASPAHPLRIAHVLSSVSPDTGGP